MSIWFAKAAVELVAFLAVLHLLSYILESADLPLTTMLLIFALLKGISVIVDFLVKGKKA